MSIFFSPRINAGDRVAGGTMTVYKDKSRLELAELWAYGDLKPDENGRGLLGNPVSIDNNGILGTPVFFDDERYQSAYYTVKDINGSLIREGYCFPMSWQGGTEPAPDDNPWLPMPGGDAFFGLQVIQSIADLKRLEPFPSLLNARPLFVRTNTAADKSGGLVVRQTDETAANEVLSFMGMNNTVWRAREEFINFSYLYKNGWQNPFQYIDIANDSNGWNYGIRLDMIPSGYNSYNYTFKGKLLIDSKIQVTKSDYSSMVTKMADAQNLAITGSGGMISSGTGSHIPIIEVSGGDWDTEQITDQNGNCFLSGFANTLRSSTATIKTTLKIGRLVLGKVPLNLEESVIWDIDALEADAIVRNNLTSFTFLWRRIRKIILRQLNSNFELTVDSDINFDIDNSKFQPSLAAWITLKGNGNAHYIKPATKGWQPDATVKAKNAEFYNGLAGIEGSGLLEVWNWCSGRIVIDDVTDGKLLINSNTVDIESNSGFRTVYAGAIGDANHVNIVVDRSKLENDNTYAPNGAARRTATFAAEDIANCELHFMTSVAPWSEGWDLFLTKIRSIRGCTLYNHFHTVVLAGTKIDKCDFQVGATPNNSTANAEWNCIWSMGNGTAIENSVFYGGMAGLWGAGDGVNFSNIHFDNNKAMGRVILDLFAGYGTATLNNRMDYGSSNNLPNTSFIVENVTFKGNIHNGDQTHAFIPVTCTNYFPNPYIKGHVEVTGYYDYSISKAVLATEKFPPEGKNFETDGSGNPVFWVIDNSDPNNIGKVAAWCLYPLGDPLKYTEKEGGLSIATNDEFNQAYPDPKLYKATMPMPRSRSYFWDSGSNSLSYKNNINCWCNVTFYRVRE